MAKPFAAYDIDGTVFKSSLVEKAVGFLVEDRLFKPEPFNEVEQMRRRWQANNTEGGYTAYLDTLVGAFVAQMAGVEVERFQSAAARMAVQQGVRRFAYPRHIAHRLRTTHYQVAISGSPEDLVRPFTRDLPMQEIHGSRYRVEDGKYTGEAESVGDKVTILQSLVSAGKVSRAGSIAIGDTLSDRGMLGYSEIAIMFNPSRTLTDYGAAKNWMRVHEVKDQISAMVWSDQHGIYMEADPYEFTMNLPVQT